MHHPETLVHEDIYSLNLELPADNSNTAEFFPEFAFNQRDPIHQRYCPFPRTSYIQ
jgi:hypothetical protein